MPRTNDGNELLKYLTTVYKYTVKSGGAATTTAEAITANMASTLLTSGTGLAALDFVLISGSGGPELANVASVATNTPTWTWPLLVPQNSGATVTEMEAKNINHIAEGGVTFGASQSSTDINAATSRVAIATFVQPAVFTFSIPVLGYNNLNFLSAFGATETEYGNGTSGTPYAAALTAANVSTEGLMCFRCEGTLENGDTFVFDLNDCSVEINVNASIGAANPEGFTIAGKCTGFASHIY